MFDFLQQSNPFALYITDHFIQLMQLKGDASQAMLQAIGSHDLAPGIVEQGKIIKEDDLVTELKNLFKKTKPNAIRGKKCIVTLPEMQTFEYIFCLKEPLEGAALQQLIAQQIQSHIPILFSDLLYDAAVNTFDKLQIIYVVATRKDFLLSYDRLLREKCNVKPVVFEPESFGLMRNFRFCFEKDKPRIFIYIYDNNIRWFLFLNELVFDSNIASIDGIQEFSKDLQKSIDVFQKESGRQVESILIAGAEEKRELLLQKLQPAFTIPMKKCDEYSADFKEPDMIKIGLKPDDLLNGDFSIIMGTALKTLGIELKVQIDLLKK